MNEVNTDQPKQSLILRFKTKMSSRLGRFWYLWLMIVIAILVTGITMVAGKRNDTKEYIKTAEDEVKAMPRIAANTCPEVIENSHSENPNAVIKGVSYSVDPKIWTGLSTIALNLWKRPISQSRKTKKKLIPIKQGRKLFNIQAQRQNILQPFRLI